MDWNIYFKKLCYAVSEKSKDPSTKVGCVIVGPDHGIRSTGFNGLPRGVRDEELPLPITTSDNEINKEIFRRNNERPYKYKWFAHAEFNAVCNAAKIGVPLDGCSLYVPWHPCSNCAMAIIQAGIKKVYLDKNFKNEELMKRWAEDHKIAETMFREANVSVEKV
jgi:dCMP deaminase